MSTTRKLSITKISLLEPALAALDGYHTEKSAELGRRISFDFDPGTRYNIGKNLELSREVLRDFEKLRSEKIKEFSPELEDTEKESIEVQLAWNRWYREHTETDLEITGLLSIKLSKLLTGPKRKEAGREVPPKDNAIPGTSLAALIGAGLIEDDLTPADKAEAVE